jgi:hypothetical protein
MRRIRLIFLVAFAFVPKAAWAQGNPLGPEFRVNTYTTGGQALPAVASDTSGNFVVTWGGYIDIFHSYIFGQRYASSGAPLGPEFRVNTYTTGGQGDSSVASDSSGNFVVVWTSGLQDGSFFGVFGQRYASLGVPLGPEFRVNTYTTGGQIAPSVASDSSGNFVVVWDSNGQDGSTYGVFGQRYTSSGAALGPEFRVNTYTTGPQRFPSVASGSSGNFVVTWVGLGQYGFADIFGQRYTSSGAPLGPEFRVNTFTINSQYFSNVASDTLGNFVIVWVSTGQDGSGTGIFGQRYASAGGPLGPEFQVNTYTTGYQNRPVVASDTSGNFVVVWESNTQDGSNWGIFGQRYASSGAALGPEFRVNTYTTSRQDRPAVASDTSGKFVVAWESDTQDGSNYGVFGQRYGPIVPVELMHFRVE